MLVSREMVAGDVGRVARRGRALRLRRYAVGAEVQEGGVDIRVWAPDHATVELVVESPRSYTLTLERDVDGYHSVFAEGLEPGARYGFRLERGGKVFPDPASRYQPDGPHGSSEVIDARSFSWTDAAWPGVKLAGQVLYEVHLGTFTREGTARAAIARLPHLRALGVTCIELMPVADFPGRFGWGYDGVALWAPHHGYGRPDDLRAFVAAAHAEGLGVILDVVYNHLGPDGNYLACFAKGYFGEHHTEWGQALNFDGDACDPVRRFFVENAGYWMDEFHFDGLRLDATQSIKDDSENHVIADITAAARLGAGSRGVIVVGENEPQDTRLLVDHGLDALWNDDFHHTAVVAATGRAEAYYSDYRGTARELLATALRGFLYQGQRSAWQKHRRGRAFRGLARRRLITYLENHDQVANSLDGRRLWQSTYPGRHRALTAYLLLGPWTPMLFQGQEWSSAAPFLYFADHEPGLAAKVRAGRAEFMSQFPSCRAVDTTDWLPDPGAVATFEASRLRWEELDGERGRQSFALHRDLLALRREDPLFARVVAGGEEPHVEGALLSDHAFVLRYLDEDEVGDKLLVVNLGPQAPCCPAPEPLIAAPRGHRLDVLWSSEDPRYGGLGTAWEPDDLQWPSESALVLRFVPEDEPAVPSRYLLAQASNAERTR